MAWGSGSFPPGVYNQEVPGTYINIKVTPPVHSEIMERGIVAIPMDLPWGLDGEVMEVTVEDYAKNAKQIFGYEIGSEEMKYIDELFDNAQTVYFYRTNSGNKAKGQYGEAKCSGTFGNGITVVIEEDPDNPNEHYNITTTLGQETKNQSLPEGFEKTTATITADSDTVTIKYANVPKGYEVMPGLLFGSGQAIVTKNRLDLEITGTTAKFIFWPEAASGQYVVDAKVRKTDNHSETVNITKQELTVDIQKV